MTEQSIAISSVSEIYEIKTWQISRTNQLKFLSKHFLGFSLKNTFIKPLLNLGLLNTTIKPAPHLNCGVSHVQVWHSVLKHWQNGFLCIYNPPRISVLRAEILNMTIYKGKVQRASFHGIFEFPPSIHHHLPVLVLTLQGYSRQLQQRWTSHIQKRSKILILQGSVKQKTTIHIFHDVQFISLLFSQLPDVRNVLCYYTDWIYTLTASLFSFSCSLFSLTGSYAVYTSMVVRSTKK